MTTENSARPPHADYGPDAGTSRPLGPGIADRREDTRPARYASDHEDTRHPDLPATADERPGLDRLVSTAADYSQGHWRDELTAARQRAEALHRAAVHEVDERDRRMAGLAEERRQWSAQADAHAATIEALAMVEARQDEAEMKRTHIPAEDDGGAWPDQRSYDAAVARSARRGMREDDRR